MHQRIATRGARLLMAFGALALTCEAVPAFAQDVAKTEVGAPAFDVAGLDAYLEEARTAWRVPGMAVAIIVDGRIAYLKGFGLRDVAAGAPVTPDTLFVGASTTKAFTSASVGLMVARGEMEWDSPVRAYLPGFATSEDPRSGEITLRDMLSHRTGLPRHDMLWYNNGELTRADLLTRLPALAFSRPLRAEWQYNNIMYMLAGHAVEAKAGKSWEDFVRSELLEPLGMGRTNFSVARMMADDNAARAYKLDEARRIIPIPLRPVDFIGPAGSINSTARDYANWALFQLTGTTPEGRRLLSPELLDEMHAALIPLGGKPEFSEFSPAFYGMGWFADSYRGMSRVQHGGNLDGFTARVTLFPDQRAASVILVNMEASSLPGYLSLDIMDRVMKLEPRNWARSMLARRDITETTQDEGKARLSETRVSGAPPAHRLAEYVGTFANPGYGTLTVAADGRKGLHGQYNGMGFALAPWHYEFFRSKARNPGDDGLDDVFFQFVTDRRGRVAGVEVELEPNVAPIRFERTIDPAETTQARFSRFTGSYVLRDQVIEVALVGGRLLLTVPGQTPYWLEPQPGGDFALAGVPSIEVRFVGDGDKAAILRFFQPTGVFDAQRRAEAVSADSPAR